MAMNLEQKAAKIVVDAGGEIIGRTRLQKIAYLLSITGQLDEFSFVYKHYGPYSEELANAIHIADLFGYATEEKHPASWGGTYSIFGLGSVNITDSIASKRELASTAAAADAIELELAATAAFFAIENHDDPWAETARRKPEKARDGRLDNAKALYATLSAIETPEPLPTL